MENNEGKNPNSAVETASAPVKPNYQYFNGTITTIDQPRDYVNKDGETKQLWPVTITDDNGSLHEAAIFDPTRLKATPETIQSLVGQKVNCSFYLTDDGNERVSVFLPWENKKSFLVSQLLEGNTEYNVVLKKVSIIKAKESGNWFVKYFLNADSISEKIDSKRIEDLMKVAEVDEATAIARINESLNKKKDQFGNFDWSIIEQISSVGPNKNGKMVEPIQTKRGIFDPIANNQKTLAAVIVKAHDATSEAKWDMKTVAASIKQTVDNNDLEALKELIKDIKDLNVFLSIANGDPKISPNRQYGRLRAFEIKKKK